MTERPIDAVRSRLRTVAVTGTNGKTSTTSMIAAIARAAGEVEARVTTIGAFVGGARVAEYDGSMKTFLAVAERAANEGARTFAIEVTSRSLENGFATRWPPDVAVFTNLTRDHLDRHGTMEAYLAAKARLFLALGPASVAVLNADDPAGGLLDEVGPPAARRLFYSASTSATDRACDLQAERVLVSRDATRIALAPSALAAALGGALELRALGAFQAGNALGAALAAHALGYGAAAIREGLRAFAGAPGRFEVVCRHPLVVVDYAHTPDALARTLTTARDLAANDGVDAEGRVFVVFGCGGDRDRGKRATMGETADALADVVFVTTDNARSEDPDAIADMILGGMRGRARVTRELDRGRAIELAIHEAGAVDVVVIAGKGHEETQTIGVHTVPFSDRAHASAACEARDDGR